MKVLSLFCALFLVACGEDTVPANHPHPNMVSDDHGHTGYGPVGALEATGFYDVAGPLTVDTCATPSLADPNVDIALGTWLVAAVQSEYLFMQDDLVLTSSDGVTFTFEDSGVDFFTGCDYVTTLTATLSFTMFDLSGPIDLQQVLSNCANPSVCDRTWELLGIRL